MTAPARIALAVLMGLVAGCTHPTPPMEEPSSGPSVQPGFRFGQCEASGGTFPVPGDDLDNSLPEGFLSVRRADVPSLVDAPVLGMVCQSGDAGVMAGYYPVLPPANLSDPSINQYWLTDGLIVQGTALEGWLAEAGASPAMARGTLSNTVLLDQSDQAIGMVEGRMPNVGLQVEYAASGSPSESQGVARLFICEITGPPWRLVAVVDVAYKAHSVTGGLASLHLTGNLPIQSVVLPGVGSRVVLDDLAWSRVVFGNGTNVGR